MKVNSEMRKFFMLAIVYMGFVQMFIFVISMLVDGEAHDELNVALEIALPFCWASITCYEQRVKEQQAIIDEVEMELKSVKGELERCKKWYV